MKLASLILQNFRSYAKKTLTFSDAITLLIGANAAGKTNVLEAIMFLATGKSFRAKIDREAIRWGDEVSRITGVADGTKLELVLTTGMVNHSPAPLKKYLVNGVSRRMIDFIGRTRVVLFWPEDLEIVTDSPSIRRKYLDTVLVQVDREYRRNLLSYEKGLRQRNKLLDLINEGKASRSQLIFWDQLLIRAGGYLTDARAAFIAFINTTTLSKHRFSVIYDKSAISESRLAQYKDEEVAAKATLVGPHRDDFLVQSAGHTARESNGLRDLSKYGSRGEQRLAVLWLKLAELDYIQTKVGDRPLLLLDDIFSELDEEHRSLVGEIVSKQQTIITSADRESVPAEVRTRAQMVLVGEGWVAPV